ncbi:uncharacterized protein TRUGW13939_08188 [Talaromyces rugulosus]|uniref:Alpha-ketoglutarate-dependent dioxygenase AlkB-like domain-containing protein n=1 Tax=Talaromyces rugulosus TaxID=121627 RepID=A0A7H8R3X5_TALRU|nr:uncharacterized protein TRUGW13939_08188 [Talaromyces rugulosus]QKX61042.1 hypothetical protein TRUGW13939_08188 [Talaromyces rugulosus]
MKAPVDQFISLPVDLTFFLIYFSIRNQQHCHLLRLQTVYSVGSSVVYRYTIRVGDRTDTMPKRKAVQESGPAKRTRRSKGKFILHVLFFAYLVLVPDAHPENEITTPVSQLIIEDSPVRGKPPVWADNRSTLCDTLSWFRSTQGGCYQSNKVCLGVLLDKDSGSRAHIDDEIIITRVGGGQSMDAKGNFSQAKDLDESTRSIDALLASMRIGIAVGLIIGNKNTVIRRQLPYRYNVLAFFRVVDIWFEQVNGKVGAQVRFQKLNLEEPSWWAIEGSSNPPPVSEREFTRPQSKECNKCSTVSNRVYEEGWMCLDRKCSAFWRLETGEPPEELHYHADFLSSREPVDDQIQPEFNLVPELLESLLECPDTSTQRIAWRGIVCPDCQKCVSRRYWSGWVCSDPSDVKNRRSTKRAIRIDEGQLVRPQVTFTREYQKFIYEIDGVGTVVHYSANRPVLGQPNGPNDLFQGLQSANLGLRRFPLQQSVVEGTLTAHFAVNFGMPYKFVVSVDSKGFSEAPREIKYALGRLTWATQQVVGSKAQAPNELLTLGYFEKMAIGYHDDGESSLGPTIATLSLGAKSTMKIRLKDEYFRGCRTRGKVPISDDAVLPGCYKFEERKALREQHQRDELTDEEYNEGRMTLAKEVTQRESNVLINMDLHHGDLVVMHGTRLQKYYEHTVISEDKLRFALTARYIKPDQVPEEEHHKGDFELEPDQVYDGR